MTTTRTAAQTVADLMAIDKRLAKYDAEGVAEDDYPGARARAELHALATDLADELAETYAAAGDAEGLAAAEERQRDHRAAADRLRKAAEHARRHQDTTVGVFTFGGPQDAPAYAEIKLDLSFHFRSILDGDDVLAVPGIPALLAATRATVLAYLDSPSDTGAGVTVAIGCSNAPHRAEAVGRALATSLTDGHRLYVLLTHQDQPVRLPSPRQLNIDPASITRLDAREEWDPTTGRVWQRWTVGTAPDGTPVLLTEAPAPTNYPTGDDGWPKLADRRLYTVWAFDSIEAARQDRDEQITRGYRTDAEIAEHIRDVP